MRMLLGLLLLVTPLFAEDQPDPLALFATEFVSITPGQGKFPQTFMMGDANDPAASPPREVTLTEPFQMGKFEIPQNLYEQVMGVNPSRWKGRRNSVETLNPGQARQFCQKATAMMRERKLIGENEEIRLPTEIEWEYCCRAGTTTRYSFGDQAQAEGDQDPKATLLDKYGWHTGNAAGNDPEVGVLAANPWGLYDMHGYLWELCSDPWKPTLDGQAATDGTHAMRGGSWKDPYPRLACSSRARFKLVAKDDAVGFRCVRAMVK